MPLPGGQADKFGNRYEGRWTVLSLVDVMDERYDSIRLEPPGSEGEGIEFWLRKNSLFEYHQVKRQNSAEGRWTIKALGQRHVLSHFFNKLNNPSATCVFTSTQDAYQLHELADRASQSVSFDEFECEYLKGQHAVYFNLLLGYWSSCSRRDAYERLRRVRVKTIDETSLQTFLEGRVETLVDGEPAATVTDILAQLALDKVGCEMTAHDLWRHLESRNCRRRDWAKDTHAIAAVERLNSHYLNALQGETINGKMILRQEAQQAIEKLTSSMVGRSILLAGEAGVGKSCVLAQITSALSEQGWPLLAFRIDRMNLALQPEEFGKKNGLPGSPAHVLAALAQGRDCALVIDQLDAVSMASGRHPDFFYCLDEIVRQALIHPHMRLVLGCRKFDIDNDHRLRKLTGKPYGIDVIQVSHLSHDTVRQVVSELGLDSSRLNPQQLELLSVPLHLNLLAGVASNLIADALSFETVKDLYDHFWTEKQKLLRLHLEDSVPWTQMIDTICNYLSDRQALSAPVIVLDEYGQKAVAAMVSEHVLTLENGMYAFFHEGFFDYAFARRFAAKSQSLIIFLLSQEQHLFRRAQLRQILLHERENAGRLCVARNAL